MLVIRLHHTFSQNFRTYQIQNSKFKIQNSKLIISLGTKTLPNSSFVIHNSVTLLVPFQYLQVAFVA